MRVRMLPISYLFQRFPRVVRDQALKLGKNVELVVEGADTEIDKRVLEQMHDPLVQLLRNAIAHAMEEPLERRKAGKPEMGTIRLAAYHEGDYVAIEIEDDGRGIDTEKLKGILQRERRIAPEQLERLSEKELLYAIFLPGISTKEGVDGTAGRGVGLDVVKENLERMNGSIEVESQSTQGTRFTIRIPLTVAIIRALMVKGSEQAFAVPLSSVSKILRYESNQVHTIEGFRVITHRGKTLPLVHLGQLLNIPSQASADGHRFIVVVTTSFREVGLVVDGLMGEREIVIKSIEDGTHDYEGFSGATILGDGTVSLILDVSALLRLMKDWPGVDPAVFDPMGFSEEPFAGQRVWS
ncbi:MAG: chemotaxis protein CheA [Syntrophobacteraceae bacterium]|nr:chemotaxis protein CheA [Syntrophobacteraceae bacterium]